MKKNLCLLLVTLCLIMSSCSSEKGKTVDTVAKEDTINTYIADAEKETEETVVETKSLSFVACGDNIIYFGTYRDAASQAYSGGRQYNFKPIYSNVESIISSADIAFINQETPCSENFNVESYPTFNSPVDLTYDVTEIGFDIVNLANNHMLDKGAKGLFDSYNNWLNRGVTVIGCYKESDQRYITYYEKNGIKIGFVSYTYGTNLYEDPANYGLYAPYLKYSDVSADVETAKSNSDFVIISVHWGDEGASCPNDEQKKFAQIMADSGADVILGHHPHVLQPIEWIEGKNGNKCLCAYSLGNFVHEQANDYNVPGGILSFNIVKKGNNTTGNDFQLIPTVCHYPANFYNNKVYLFKDYTEDLASSHAVASYYHNPISLNSLENYIKNTISSEFLPDYMN